MKAAVLSLTLSHVLQTRSIAEAAGPGCVTKGLLSSAPDEGQHVAMSLPVYFRQKIFPCSVQKNPLPSPRHLQALQ